MMMTTNREEKDRPKLKRSFGVVPLFLHHALLSNGAFRLHRALPPFTTLDLLSHASNLVDMWQHINIYYIRTITSGISKFFRVPRGSHNGMVGALTGSGNACNQTLAFTIMLLIRIVLFVPNQLRK